MNTKNHSKAKGRKTDLLNGTKFEPDSPRDEDLVAAIRANA